MTVVSKRIEEFERAMRKNPQTAREALENELRTAGGPLVEEIEGDDTNVLVTFVWIGDAPGVSVRGTQFPDPKVPEHPMTRVEGTKVWHWSAATQPDVTTVYQYVVGGLAHAEHTGDPKDFLGPLRSQAERSHADPFNPKRIYPQLSVIASDLDAPEERWESVLDLPDAEPVSLFDESGAPPGTLTEHRLVSRALANERTVTVYAPPGYSQSGGPHPLVVLLDGECWPRVARLHVALDNLVAAGRIPACVAAFVHNPPVGPSENPIRARNVEMECNPAFAGMLADELLPMLRERYRVTSDPDQTIIGGTSLAGVAAAHAAFERPEAFGAVLSCSGAHWWGWDGAGGPAAWFVSGKDGEPE